MNTGEETSYPAPDVDIRYAIGLTHIFGENRNGKLACCYHVYVGYQYWFFFFVFAAENASSQKEY
jgi:hypothetical protein